MLNWIVEQAEGERHFSYFEDRARMWKIFKESGFKLLGALTDELETQFADLTAKYRNVTDGYILLQQAWGHSVGCMLTNEPTSSSHQELVQQLQLVGQACPDLDSDSMPFHLNCIIQTVAKHTFMHLKNRFQKEKSWYPYWVPWPISRWLKNLPRMVLLLTVLI